MNLMGLEDYSNIVICRTIFPLFRGIFGIVSDAICSEVHIHWVSPALFNDFLSLERTECECKQSTDMACKTEVWFLEMPAYFLSPHFRYSSR